MSRSRQSSQIADQRLAAFEGALSGERRGLLREQCDFLFLREHARTGAAGTGKPPCFYLAQYAERAMHNPGMLRRNARQVGFA